MSCTCDNMVILKCVEDGVAGNFISCCYVVMKGSIERNTDAVKSSEEQILHE